MKPNPILIEALRKVATHLRKGGTYSWQNSVECNCGQLAQALGCPRDMLYEVSLQTCGPWTAKVRSGYMTACGTTGLSLRTVVKRLLDAGVELSDFERIEYLDRGQQSSEVIAYWMHRDNVARWMDAQADRLEAQLAGQGPAMSATIAAAPLTTLSTAPQAVLRWAGAQYPPQPYEHTHTDTPEPAGAAPAHGHTGPGELRPHHGEPAGAAH